MTWVKICGMTNLEDTLVAVDAGADAVGFVFYEKSPRNISITEAHAIVDKLPAGIEKVGVFVNESDERIRSVAADLSLSAVQLYGEAPVSRAQSEIPELPLNNFNVIVALKSDRLVPGALLPGSLPGSMVHAILVDSGSGDTAGGTGATFDWESNREYVKALGETARIKIVIAGGLTSENVSKAIDVFAPWGVDVVSGVEARPGKKDPEKVRAFVRTVREYDRRAS